MVRALRLLGLTWLFVFSVWCFAVAGYARADVYVPPSSPTEPSESGSSPSCPSGPGTYEGTDEAVAAIYGEERDQVAVCESLGAQAAQLSRRLFWLVAEAEGDRTDRAAELSLLGEIAEAPAGPPGSPAAVDEEGFLSIRFALWVIAGILVTALAAYTIVRLVVFRDN